MSEQATSERGMTRTSTIGWLVRHTRSLLAPLALSALARICSQLLGIGLLVLPGSAVVAAADRGRADALSLAAVLVAMALLKAILRYAEHYAGHWVAFTALQRLRELFFARLVPQAPAATKGRAGSALTETATRDVDRIEVFFAHTFPPAVSAVAVPALALAWVGITASAALAWLLAPFVMVVLLIPLISAGTVWQQARAVSAARGEVAAHMGDDVAGVREVLMTGAQDKREAGLDTMSRRLTRARSRSGAVEGIRTGLIGLVQTGSVIAVVAVGIRAQLSVEAVVIGLAVAIGLWGPARGVESFAAGLDSALASAERLRNVVDAAPVVVDPGPDTIEPRHTGTEGPSVEYRLVSFSHPPRAVAAEGEARGPVADSAAAPRSTLTGISATFPGGAWSYVAGVSGSGKSTLASLLLRDWDPDEGRVLLGGQDVSRLALDELRRRVAIVDQRPTLLADTVWGNVTLAAPQASQAHVQEALAAVGLQEWAMRLPEGLDTVLASGRNEVSGGQLQRLALARALVPSPQVLVLDEALSQLDGETADHVRRQLRERRPGLTTVEITHRVDLVDDASFVAVIDAGRLVEAGAAGKLRARGGAFARLQARTDQD